MNVFVKKKTFAWQKAVAGIIALFLFIAILNLFRAPVRNAFFQMTSPVSRSFLVAGNGMYQFVAPFFQIQGLRQENSNLKQENEKLLSEISLSQQQALQNQATQQVIQNTKDDHFALVLSKTVGLDAANSIILIDKGSADGIKENMPVISSNKVLYGKVLKVYPNFSQVMLISNKNSVVDAQILSSDVAQTTPLPPPVYGVIKGNDHFSVYLDLVPSEAQMNPGDALVTSGLEGIFPKNLLIGKIISKTKNDLKPFQTAQVQPLFNVNTIDNLFIITNYLKK